MNRLEHLLTISAEECCEVGQRLAKAQRFGLDQIQKDWNDKPEENPERLTNRERIVREFEDLCTVLDMAGIITIEHGGALMIDDRRQEQKRKKVERYLERSRACGTLSETEQ